MRRNGFVQIPLILVLSIVIASAAIGGAILYIKKEKSDQRIKQLEQIIDESEKQTPTPSRSALPKKPDPSIEIERCKKVALGHSAYVYLTTLESSFPAAERAQMEQEIIRIQNPQLAAWVANPPVNPTIGEARYYIELVSAEAESDATLSNQITARANAASATANAVKSEAYASSYADCLK